MPHLAQVNVARAKGPMDGAVMAEFARALDPINLLAERSPGFVWRLQDADGDVRGNAAVAMQKAMKGMLADTMLDAPMFSVFQWASFVVYGLADVRC